MGLNMILKRQQRKRVRDIARNHFRWHTADLIPARDGGSSFLDKSVKERIEIAKVGVKEDLQEAFGSGIVANLLISLAFKLAMKYFERWIEEKIFGYEVPADFDEA